MEEKVVAVLWSYCCCCFRSESAAAGSCCPAGGAARPRPRSPSRGRSRAPPGLCACAVLALAVLSGVLPRRAPVAPSAQRSLPARPEPPAGPRAPVPEVRRCRPPVLRPPPRGPRSTGRVELHRTQHLVHTRWHHGAGEGRTMSPDRERDQPSRPNLGGRGGRSRPLCPRRLDRKPLPPLPDPLVDPIEAGPLNGAWPQGVGGVGEETVRQRPDERGDGRGVAGRTVGVGTGRS